MGLSWGWGASAKLARLHTHRGASHPWLGRAGQLTPLPWSPAHPPTRTLGLSCNGPLRARFMYSTAGAPATSASGAVKNSLEPGAARGIEPCQGLASGLELRPAGPPPAPRGRWKAAWRLGAAAVCTLADLQQQSDNTAADGAGMPACHSHTPHSLLRAAAQSAGPSAAARAAAMMASGSWLAPGCSTLGGSLQRR